MPRKGMRSIFFRSSSPSRTSIPPSSPSLRFSESLMEDNIEIVESLLKKWDSDFSTYAKITSLFHGDRTVAKQYIHSVKGLQSAMQYLVTQNAASDKLVKAQNLMERDMKRLEKEFYQILSANRDHLDPESVSTRSSRSSASRSRLSISDLEDDELEDELPVAGESKSEVKRVSVAAMADLKSIADCMISTGYAKECVKIYKIICKSIIDEALYHLGVEKLSLSQMKKMDWEVLELKIGNWVKAVKIGVKTLFHGERILLDHVFSASVAIKESCFAEISRESAMRLFGFPELVAKCKKSPEKIFRTLDLYEAISDLWPEIETIFSYESTSVIRSQAISSLINLGDSVRTMLVDFEKAILKDSSRTSVSGGGVHPLMRYVMNCICFLADYSGVLADIVADWALVLQSPLPESYLGSPGPEDSPISIRIALLILVLLCKLDGKAKFYKDVALSNLFLANNLQYVVVKVRTSEPETSSCQQYASNYELMGWSRVFESLPENPTIEISPEQAKVCFKRFNTAFGEAYRTQKSWVVTNPKLRDEIKVSVAKKLGSVYRSFYSRYQFRFGSEAIVKYAPDDLENYLSDLLYRRGGAGSISSSYLSSHLRSRLSR
ncbi:hypothetical protein I3842_14G076000 [Carya illinoinensis]|uniref:Exocyst subunit Exo70 family protein n=1 Tax=Carya illinoinensis TaxID=32201 RepID=A0A922DCW3_CARIL|nr:hypothetical protein I3842_14G076000 [Carya illinoinensis]